MPFTRRRTRRRRRTSRRPRALMAVRRLARFVDTELHQVTTNLDVFNVQGATPNFSLLTQIALGDDADDRMGVQVTLRSVAVKFLVTRGNADAAIRIIMFLDKQTNGAAPVAGDLLQLTTSITETFVSPLNNDNKRRFTILSDRSHQVTLGRGESVLFGIRRSLNSKVRYDGGGQTIIDIVSGALWIMMFTTGIGGAASPTVSLAARVRFAP